MFSLLLLYVCPQGPALFPWISWPTLNRFDLWDCIGFVAGLAVKTVTNIEGQGRSGRKRLIASVSGHSLDKYF